MSQVPESEAEWAAGLDPKEMVDTRNWELMPCIGGKRENIQDLRHLMLAEARPEGVVLKIRVGRAVRQFLNGEEVKLPSTGLDQVSRDSVTLTRSLASGSQTRVVICVLILQAGLNETDRAYYSALLTLLERALSKSTASLETLYDSQSVPGYYIHKADIVDIASIKLDGSRWSTYHQIVSVLQVGPPSHALLPASCILIDVALRKGIHDLQQDPIGVEQKSQVTHCGRSRHGPHIARQGSRRLTEEDSRSSKRRFGA